MSNRDCNGDFYEVDGERWYRCLWDGAVVAAANASGGSCPHCERKIDASDQGQVRSRQFIVTEAFYGGRWNEHSTVDGPQQSESGAP